MAQHFVAFATDEKLTDIDALVQAVVPFFSGKVDEFCGKACEKLPVDQVINIYSLLADYSTQTPDKPSGYCEGLRWAEPPCSLLFPLESANNRDIKIFLLCR